MNVLLSDDHAPGAGPLAGLTPRQRDVLQRLVQGKPNKVIARELGISDTTVKTHVSAVLQCLGVTNRTQAAIAVQQMHSA